MRSITVRIYIPYLWLFIALPFFSILLYSLYLLFLVLTVVDNRVAPSITTQSSSMTVDLGSRVTLSCTATGNPTPSIRWYKDGKAIAGPQAIGNDFVIPEVTPGERGFYQCEAFSSFGNPSRSAEAEILIKG